MKMAHDRRKWRQLVGEHPSMVRMVTVVRVSNDIWCSIFQLVIFFMVVFHSFSYLNHLYYLHNTLITGRKPIQKKPDRDEVIDLDALTKDTTSPNYILFPLIEASRTESQLAPFKSNTGLMGVAVKEMPTNEVISMIL